MKETGQALGRTRNFQTRLRIEREVLQIVNSTVKLPELFGLTKDAIDAWCATAAQNLPASDIDRIRASLTMIARVTGTISDNSRAIVSENAVSASRDSLLQDLRTLVATC